MKYNRRCLSNGHKKVIKGLILDPVGFAVDDGQLAYPNGALHTDGYYYELIGQVASTNIASVADAVSQSIKYECIMEAQNELNS